MHVELCTYIVRPRAREVPYIFEKVLPLGPWTRGDVVFIYIKSSSNSIYGFIKCLIFYLKGGREPTLELDPVPRGGTLNAVIRKH